MRHISTVLLTLFFFVARGSGTDPAPSLVRIVVLDTSGSMDTDGRIDQAKQEILAVAPDAMPTHGVGMDTPGHFRVLQTPAATHDRF